MDNPVGVLNELAFKENLPLPEYVDLDTLGTQHAPTFVIQVNFKGFSSIGKGSSKKEAKRNAAKQICSIIDSPCSDEVTIFVIKGCVVNVSRSKGHLVTSSKNGCLTVSHETLGSINVATEGPHVIRNHEGKLIIDTIENELEQITNNIDQVKEIGHLKLY